MANTIQSGPARSIRFRLIVAVNSSLLLLVAAFLVYDYGRELNDRFDEKITALQEEAKTLLPSVLHLKPHGQEIVQSYIDDVCGRMKSVDSPNHHIAVELDGQIIQAHAHHRQSDELVAAMKRAASNNQQRIRTAQNDLVVGVQSQNKATVFVSEDVSTIRSQVFADVMRRMWAMVLMGLIAAAIVNWMLVRMVTRPLQSLVEKVREVGQGKFAKRLPSFGSIELNYLSTEINSMSDALVASEHERKIRLDKARNIQQNLLPEDLNLPGLSVGMTYCPAEEVGGDYFDILPCGENEWLVCVADATDHGVPAAMTAAMLKTMLLQAKEHEKSPARILRKMNRVFMDVNLYGDFASIILLRLDLNSNTLTYANAGHDPAWLIDSTCARELSATGTLLGIEVDTDWEDQSVVFSDHTRLAISTDGITETFDVNQRQFGKQRLLDVLMQHVSIPAADTAKVVEKVVAEFRGTQTQADDVTLLLIDLAIAYADKNGKPGGPMSSALDLNPESSE